jgi:hypothetical protein
VANLPQKAESWLIQKRGLLADYANRLASLPQKLKLLEQISGLLIAIFTVIV